MHAGVVQRELVGGNLVRLHVRGIGMAMTAGLRHVRRIDAGARIVGRKDVVNAVAIHADGDFVIALRKPLAMNAGEILRILVGAQRRIEPSHVSSVRVTPCAEARNLGTRRSVLEPLRRTHGHGHVVRGGIAPMAGNAGNALLRVNALRKLLKIDVKRGVELGMAIEARIFGLRRKRRNEEQGQRGAEQNGEPKWRTRRPAFSGIIPVRYGFTHRSHPVPPLTCVHAKPTTIHPARYAYSVIPTKYARAKTPTPVIQRFPRPCLSLSKKGRQVQITAARPKPSTPIRSPAKGPTFAGKKRSV